MWRGGWILHTFLWLHVQVAMDMATPNQCGYNTDTVHAQIIFINISFTISYADQREYILSLARPNLMQLFSVLTHMIQLPLMNVFMKALFMSIFPRIL